MPPEISLDQLDRGRRALVVRVEDHAQGDVISGRLRSIGFVPGEQISVQTYGPFGREPLLVQVGMTRFALRRAEAARVIVEKAGVA